jgi:hypothetical protein
MYRMRGVPEIILLSEYDTLSYFRERGAREGFSRVGGVFIASIFICVSVPTQTEKLRCRFFDTIWSLLCRNQYVTLATFTYQNLFYVHR